MALPGNSVVRAALEYLKSVATLLRVTLLARWAGELSLWRGTREPVRDAMQDAASRRPQPLAMFPELARLIVHDAWLADPAVRAQRMWVDEGWDGAHYAYFILSNDHLRALGILMRDHEPSYLRLHFNYAFAAVDGAMWAREIHHQPVGRPLIWGGIDAKRHCTWSVRVVQRYRRCEVQITDGGLIPETYDCRSLEEATLKAEACLTDFVHVDDDRHDHRDENRNGDRRSESGWLM